MFLGGCPEIAKLLPEEYQFRCCGSCHCEFEGEWSDPLEVYADDDYEGFYSCCCGSAEALRKYYDDNK